MTPHVPVEPLAEYSAVCGIGCKQDCLCPLPLQAPWFVGRYDASVAVCQAADNDELDSEPAKPISQYIPFGRQDNLGQYGLKRNPAMCLRAAVVG